MGLVELWIYWLGFPGELWREILPRSIMLCRRSSELIFKRRSVSFLRDQGHRYLGCVAWHLQNLQRILFFQVSPGFDEWFASIAFIDKELLLHELQYAKVID